MREIDKISGALFEKIRDRFEDVSLGDENAKATQKPEDARFFNFDYVVDGKNYGNVTISLVDEMSLKIYFSKNISQGLDDVEKKKWYQFLKELREFAKRNLLSFEPRDITRGTLKQRDIQQVSKSDNTFDKNELELNEGRMYGSTKSSYEKDGNTRIIVRHSEAVNPEVRGARARKINAIFVENSEGERFKLPYNNLRYARAMARHVSEGGSLSDDFGKHITEIAEESIKLRPFKNGMQRRTFEDTETQEMVEAAFEYHGLLNNTLKKLSGRKGYQECKASFAANEPLMDDVDIDSLKDRFVRRVFDDRLEDALPIVQKAYNMKKENKFAQQFESWANRLTEGTWALPESDEQIEELKALLSEPLQVGVDATNATGALYNLVGNDSLFDLLGDIAEENPEEDVSGVVKDWLRNNMPEVFAKLGISDEEYDADVDSYFDNGNEELSEGKYWDNPNTNNYNQYYDALVPGSGAAETLEGELLRAATRINYDLHNNGFGNNWTGALEFLNKYLNTDINNEYAILRPYAGGAEQYHGRYDNTDRVVVAADSLVDKVLAQIEAANGQYQPSPGDMFDLQGPMEYPEEEDEDYWDGNEYDDEDELDEGTYGGTGTDDPVVDPNVTEDDTGLNVGIEAYGVRGMKSKPWRKTFKSQAAFEKWLEKTEGDVEVQGTREVNINDMFKEGEHEGTIAAIAKAAYRPEVGDKIVTRKGGQIPGTVEKVEEKNGIEYVFFRHPEGKLYKTSVSNVMRDRVAQPVTEDSSEHPAYNAIIHRILRQHPEIVTKYGIDKVDDAVQRECEWIGDVEEIGSSDVSIWVREVISDLNTYAQQVNENLSTSLDKMQYKGQNLELEQWPDGKRTISSGSKVLRSGPATEISKLWANLKKAAKDTVSQMSGGVMENDEEPLWPDEDETNEPLGTSDRGPGEWPAPKQKWDRTNPEYEPDEYGNPDSLEEATYDKNVRIAELKHAIANIQKEREEWIRRDYDTEELDMDIAAYESEIKELTGETEASSLSEIRRLAGIKK